MNHDQLGPLIQSVYTLNSQVSLQEILSTMTGFSILVNAKEKISADCGVTHHRNRKRHMHQNPNALCTLLRLRKKRATVPPTQF